MSALFPNGTLAHERACNTFSTRLKKSPEPVCHGSCIQTGRPVCIQPTVGPGKPLSWGPIIPSFRMHRDRDVSLGEGENMGRGVPSPPDYLGQCRKLAQQVPGLCRKWILCIYEVRKKPSGTPFSIFLSDGGPPNVVGPGKTFTPRLDGPTDRTKSLLWQWNEQHLE